MGLGLAHLRFQGGRGDRHAAAAVAALTAAVRHADPAADPELWAAGHLNLGNAHMRRAAEGEPDGATAAVGVYLEARSVFSRESHPYRWATLRNNLGNAYLKRSAGDRDADVLAACEEYGRSLEVFTRDRYPAEWARGHGNLGAAALEFRTAARRRAEAPRAIEAIQRALDVYTPDADLDEWARNTKNLGTAYLEDGNADAAVHCWQRAHDHWAAVIEWAVGTDAPARQMTELARRIAHARAAQGRHADAVAALEAAKAVGLRLEIARARGEPANLSDDERLQYQSLWKRSRELVSERRLLDPIPTIPTPVAAGPSPEIDVRGRLADISATLEAAFDQLRRLQARDPAFTAPPPDYRAVRDTAVAHGCCFVYLHGPLHPEDPLRGWVVHPGSPPDDVPDADRLLFPELTRKHLLRLFRGPAPGRPAAQALAAAARGDAVGWEEAYAVIDRPGTPGWEAWERTVSRVTGELGPALAVPLAARLGELPARRVFLLPDGLLTPFPVAALPLGGAGGETLGDRFAVSVVPSAATARECLESTPPARPAAPELTAVVNPDGTLPFAEDQVGRTASRFVRTAVATGPETRREWLLANAGRADFVSFATHGRYEPAAPSRSRLLLAHRAGAVVPCKPEHEHEFDRLSLDDLWASRLPLRRGCVVSADACETGLLDPHIGHNESFGFPAAFLAAGASGVVATVWSVSDFAASLLMDRAYELMLAGHRPAEAVAAAAAWLRQLSRAEVICLAKGAERRAAGDVAARRAAALDGASDALWRYQMAKRREASFALFLTALERRPDPPYAEPVYWAAFVAFGA